MLRKIAAYALLAALLLPALLLAQTQNPAFVTYFPSNPTTSSCLAGYLWVNTTTKHLWSCKLTVNPPQWEDLTAAAGGGGVTFPLVLTDGTDTVTVQADADSAGAVEGTEAYFEAQSPTGGVAHNGVGVNPNLARAVLRATDGAAVLGYIIVQRLLALASIEQHLEVGAGHTVNLSLNADPAGDKAVTINGSDGDNVFRAGGEANSGGAAFSISAGDEDASDVGEFSLNGGGGTALASFGIDASTVGMAAQFQATLGGLADLTTGVKPACDANNTRRRRWYTQGGNGVADTYEVCMKSAADTYAWVVIASNP